MSKVIYRAEKSKLPSMGFPGATFLAMLPVLAIFYVTVALPLWPGDGKERPVNILIWPVVALLTLIFIFKNWPQSRPEVLPLPADNESDRLPCVRDRERNMGL